jgi:hypothetical protein
MVFRNLLKGGPSRCRPLLGPSKSLRGGTSGTNPHQQSPSAWQVSKCWVIWIFLVSAEFAKYSLSRTKYLSKKLLSVFCRID